MRNRNSPFVREGWPFIGFALLILIVLIVFSMPAWLNITWFLLTIWVIAFFRNPERVIPPGDDVIVCPADGEVVAVEEIEDTRFGMGQCHRVCIFMSPFNVHVNRVPVSGTVKEIRYQPGKFHVASTPQASEENEMCAMVLETDNQVRVAVVQIAGALARRIVTYPREGDRLIKGQRYGLIRFGSRVDLYLPPQTTIHVTKGERVFGGSTAIGRMPDGDQHAKE